jgi:hypothetical protein
LRGLALRVLAQQLRAELGGPLDLLEATFEIGYNGPEIPRPAHIGPHIDIPEETFMMDHVGRGHDPHVF